jgi:uncharacterized protein YbjT (DUF2867 family)
MKTPVILAIGAAGKFAGLVVPALALRSVDIRAFITDATQETAVRAKGAAEIAVGDLRDQKSVDAALEGVDAVFYIAPAFLPDESVVGENFVKSASRAGVRRFVFSSVIHPILTALDNHRAKIPVEEALVDSDMEFVLLHPGMFFQNYIQGWPDVLKTGVLAEPWSTTTRFSRVDYRDVAEVAAIALLEDRLTFGTYELCATGRHDRIDVAKIVSDVLGRNIVAAKAELPKVQKPAASATDNSPSGAIEKMLRWYDSHGLVGNSLTLKAILGREPTTLRSFFKELAGSTESQSSDSPPHKRTAHGRG